MDSVIKNYREKNQIYYSEEFLSLTKKCEISASGLKKTIQT